MEILKLKIKNFRSFSNKETEIDISGKFNVFVGKNGSGKTSIIIAIRYALFGTQGIDIKADDLVNNINKDNMSVTLICKENDKDIIIKRGRVQKQSYVKLWINEKELDLPSVKDYDKKIEELIGFNYKMFDYFSINSQIFTKNFFKMKKSERDNFLKKAIGIEDFYLLIEKFKDIKKKYQYEKESIEKEILIFQNLLKEKEQRLSFLKSTFVYQSEKYVQKRRKELYSHKEETEKETEQLFKDVKQEENLKKFELEKKTILNSIKKEKEELKNAVNANTLNTVVKEIEKTKKSINFLKTYENKNSLLKNAKQRFYQKILFLNKKEETAINKFDKITGIAEAIKQKGTYLNKITKGNLESFVQRYGEGIIRFLFIADKRFYFEKEKVFISAKIELSNSQKILKEYNEFKEKLFISLKRHKKESFLKKIEEEKKELTKKYKGYIKPLLRDVKQIKINEDYQTLQKRLEKLLEKKSEIEKIIKKQEDIKEKELKIKELENKIEKLKKYSGTLEKYNKKTNILNELNKEILKLETEYKKHEEVKNIEKEIKTYQKKLKTKKESVSEYNIKIKKCDEIIKKDSKESIKKATEDFLKIFNFYIQKYIEELSIEFYIKIKNDFSFLLKERGKNIDYSTLSKGEETVLNLLIIFALNETLKTLSNINFNLLIFDEIDGTLDENNLQKVINKLAELKKDIIFVSHRKEIFETEEHFKNIKIYKVEKDLFTKITP